MDRDQADGLFGCDGPQLLLHLAGVETKTARANEIDTDEIAVFGAERVRLGDVQLAAGLFFVDRDQAPASVNVLAENAEHARLGVIEHFENAAAIGDAVADAIIKLFDA